MLKLNRETLVEWRKALRVSGLSTRRFDAYAQVYLRAMARGNWHQGWCQWLWGIMPQIEPVLRDGRLKDFFDQVRLVEDEDVFDLEYTDWWSNECILTDAPKVITDYMARLPREER
jgi:hypothetical protein